MRVGQSLQSHAGSLQERGSLDHPRDFTVAIKGFTRQRQWALQQCKRLLNHEAVEEAPASSHQPVQAVVFQGECAGPGASDTEEAKDEWQNVEACTTSTDTADDYARRGRGLGSSRPPAPPATN